LLYCSYFIVQTGANEAIILAYGLFTCAVRPNLEKTKQLLASTTEAAVCIVFFARKEGVANLQEIAVINRTQVVKISRKITN